MDAYGQFSLIVDPQDRNQRLDAFIAGRLTQISRSRITTLIQEGLVRVDDAPRKPGYKVKPGDVVVGNVPPPVSTTLTPEAIRLDIIHEDDFLIVINKPAGMVVHPAAGHWTGTLVNALLHHCPDMLAIGGEKRPGIVHRLDKDTSGVLVVAKNDPVHQALADQFKRRQVQKNYLAIVRGRIPVETGQVDLPVGRHPVERKKMSTISRHGRPALTLWRVVERFAHATLLEIDLKTGRTHQIRVHCAAMGHPVLGDKVYGRQKNVALGSRGSSGSRALLASVQRQLLHAARIAFTHPVTGRPLALEAPLPGDMAAFLEKSRLLSATTAL
jgi:23S rRNA pseudouridine1911/1915/1917 synthase